MTHGKCAGGVLATGRLGAQPFTSRYGTPLRPIVRAGAGRSTSKSTHARARSGLALHLSLLGAPFGRELRDRLTGVLSNRLHPFLELALLQSLVFARPGVRIGVQLITRAKRCTRSATPKRRRRRGPRRGVGGPLGGTPHVAVCVCVRAPWRITSLSPARRDRGPAAPGRLLLARPNSLFCRWRSSAMASARSRAAPGSSTARRTHVALNSSDPSTVIRSHFCVASWSAASVSAASVLRMSMRLPLSTKPTCPSTRSTNSTVPFLRTRASNARMSRGICLDEDVEHRSTVLQRACTTAFSRSRFCGCKWRCKSPPRRR